MLAGSLRLIKQYHFVIYWPQAPPVPTFRASILLKPQPFRHHLLHFYGTIFRLYVFLIPPPFVSPSSPGEESGMEKERPSIDILKSPFCRKKQKYMVGFF